MSVVLECVCMGGVGWEGCVWLFVGVCVFLLVFLFFTLLLIETDATLI